jgi:hypothetical protein
MCGHGVNMGKNQSKALHIQGNILCIRVEFNQSLPFVLVFNNYACFSRFFLSLVSSQSL